MCEDPTAEDKEWFPDLAGSGDWRQALKHAWTNYRDESFFQQFLSPKIIRDFKFFSLYDEEDSPVYKVSAIHDERGYRKVRQLLASSYDIGLLEPNIQVVRANLSSDRKLILKHIMHNQVPLDEAERLKVLAHIKRLWGHEVELIAVNEDDVDE